jgi:hypothetical protein
MIDSQVIVTLKEKSYTLLPTVDALLKINRACGSLTNAARALQSLDFEALCSVIVAGANLSQKQAALVPREVFVTGVVNVAPQLGPYLNMILNPNGDAEEETPDTKE